jgi:hypothetical protein
MDNSFVSFCFQGHRGCWLRFQSGSAGQLAAVALACDRMVGEAGNLHQADAFLHASHFIGGCRRRKLPPRSSARPYRRLIPPPAAPTRAHPRRFRHSGKTVLGASDAKWPRGSHPATPPPRRCSCGTRSPDCCANAGEHISVRARVDLDFDLQVSAQMAEGASMNFFSEI